LSRRAAREALRAAEGRLATGGDLATVATIARVLLQRLA
jgi:hypothetical protein